MPPSPTTRLTLSSNKFWICDEWLSTGPISFRKAPVRPVRECWQISSHLVASGRLPKTEVAQCRKWQFTINGSDAASPAQAVITGPAAASGTWTHLVGVYDAASGQASLFVNGTPAGTAAVPATFNGTGSFILGRALSGGTQDDYWNGSLSDVQTWTYALTPDQVTALYQQIQ